MTVAEMLSMSRAAHLRYRQAAGRINAHGMVSQPTRLTVAGRAVQEALSLRTDAHALDPVHEDPAWLVDEQANRGQTHTQLVEFYCRYLAPAEAYAEPSISSISPQ
ncbi:MAG: hypothetical protein A3E01_18470 [Gammaproteobacteria bacterium RIFCSPHIGHO2_12_FULL_63_22]|nr:MAG: hypothetical protein A3E01_18470 [Gammaproteobacteria bacterium RIFCSPHIGHO2_12_FULL_63_22]